MQKRGVKLGAIVLLLIAILCNTVSAHSATEEGTIARVFHKIGEDQYNNDFYDYCLGSEDIGWVAHEGMHTASSSTVYYKFDSGVSTDLRQTFVQGATKWAGIINFVVRTNSAVGTVYAVNNPYYEAAAWTSDRVYDSNHHLTSWSIYINTYYTFTAKTAAHELGHVIGLIDLYDTANINKLMYFSTASTATAPTESDKKGARVILGIHGNSKPTNPHVWDYKHYGTDSSGNHLHVKYCTVCDGYHALSSAYPNTPDTALCTFTEAYTGNNYHAGAYHYYQYRKTCTVCGHSYTYYQKLSCSGPPCPTPQSVGDDDI